MENREPLFHIVKRGKSTLKINIFVRVISIICAFLFCALILKIAYQTSISVFIKSLFQGNFGNKDVSDITRKKLTWQTFYYVSILLGLAVGLAPAFKMKFWNIGADGQALIGGLCAAFCMHKFQKVLPDNQIILLSLVLAIIGGALWGVIPAIFKAYFKTNETLFTLMMNYIAIQLVSYFVNVWDKTKHGILNPMTSGNLPSIGGNDFPGSKYALTIFVILLITAIVSVYLRFTKHGFEVSILGESENTAKYVGINVKKTLIRTLALSGAICGIVGFLIVAGYNHTVSTTTIENRGFTAIIVAWLAKFNPLYMILTSFLVIFLQRATKQLLINISVTNDAFKDIIVGLFFFFIIGFEFFLSYIVVFRKNGVIDRFNQKIKDIYNKIVSKIKSLFNKVFKKEVK